MGWNEKGADGVGVQSSHMFVSLAGLSMELHWLTASVAVEVFCGVSPRENGMFVGSVTELPFTEKLETFVLAWRD